MANYSAVLHGSIKVLNGLGDSILGFASLLFLLAVWYRVSENWLRKAWVCNFGRISSLG